MVDREVAAMAEIDRLNGLNAMGGSARAVGGLLLLGWALLPRRDRVRPSRLWIWIAAICFLAGLVWSQVRTFY